MRWSQFLAAMVLAWGVSAPAFARDDQILNQFRKTPILELKKNYSGELELILVKPIQDVHQGAGPWLETIRFQYGERRYERNRSGGVVSLNIDAKKPYCTAVFYNRKAPGHSHGGHRTYAAGTDHHHVDVDSGPVMRIRDITPFFNDFSRLSFDENMFWNKDWRFGRVYLSSLECFNVDKTFTLEEFYQVTANYFKVEAAPPPAVVQTESTWDSFKKSVVGIFKGGRAAAQRLLKSSSKSSDRKIKELPGPGDVRDCSASDGNCGDDDSGSTSQRAGASDGITPERPGGAPDLRGD